MPLKPCKECGKAISTEAKVCPHCGKKNPTQSRTTPTAAAAGCLFIIAVVVVVALIGNSSSNSPDHSKFTPPTAADRAQASRLRDSTLAAMARKDCGSTGAARARTLNAAHPGWEMIALAQVACKKVSVGLTAAQVRAAWGNPDHVNTTTTANGDHEQWVYGDEYVYVDEGVVTAMQTKK